jgi:hypothetical protein
MVYFNLRLACLSIAALLYQAQALPLPVEPGDVVYMQPAQRVGVRLDFLFVLLFS